LGAKGFTIVNMAKDPKVGTLSGLFHPPLFGFPAYFLHLFHFEPEAGEFLFQDYCISGEGRLFLLETVQLLLEALEPA